MRLVPLIMEGSFEMRPGKLLLLPLLALPLAGCLETDTERGFAGAATGAIIADALDTNVAAGAIIGGGAGIFCDDAGICY